jgi:hypothetical protein
MKQCVLAIVLLVTESRDTKSDSQIYLALPFVRVKNSGGVNLQNEGGVLRLLAMIHVEFWTERQLWVALVHLSLEIFSFNPQRKAKCRDRSTQVWTHHAKAVAVQLNLTRAKSNNLARPSLRSNFKMPWHQVLLDRSNASKLAFEL